MAAVENQDLSVGMAAVHGVFDDGCRQCRPYRESQLGLLQRKVELTAAVDQAMPGKVEQQ